MKEKMVARLVMFFLITYAVGISAYLIANESQSFDFLPLPAEVPVRKAKLQEIKQFQTEQDFKNYISKASVLSSVSNGSFGRAVAAPSLRLQTKAMDLDAVEESLAGDEAGAGQVERVSGTNVQTAGIDEPDIIKTDGENLYLSSESRYYYPLLREKRISIGMPGSSGFMPPYQETPPTKILDAFPPAEIAEIGKIAKNGNLLLAGKMLAVFSAGEITGYDVADPKNPREKWNLKMKDNSALAGSRLINGKIYAVIKNQINTYKPCPVVPLTKGDKPVSIACDRIYRPVNVVPIDATYSALMIDPATGETEKSVSFVGSSGNSSLYMSAEAIYVSYQFQGDFVDFMRGFFKANGNLIPEGFLAKMDRLSSYDISASSKSAELSTLIEQYRSSLSEDDRLKFDTEMNNKLAGYLETNKRDLEKTGIAKIGLDDFKADGIGVVPGVLLNQFSMDEYQGNLRVATTIGRNGFWMLGFGGSSQSTNDVYVLDKKMAVIGSVKDLGKEERIYSVRFIKDKGYVVTFKQIDPFFVLDLSDPKSPALKGELKIPGFSSYLHPLADNVILGVGQENGQVKLSLFDVSKPESPAEIANYKLDEYWTEVSSNHHAFLQDAKHQVFFIPGGKGGYVFSYEGKALNLKKAVSGVQANRAIYINDYLYIIGADKITVLDENSWEKAGEASLN